MCFSTFCMCISIFCKFVFQLFVNVYCLLMCISTMFLPQVHSLAAMEAGIVTMALTNPLQVFQQQILSKINFEPKKMLTNPLQFFQQKSPVNVWVLFFSPSFLFFLFCSFLWGGFPLSIMENQHIFIIGYQYVLWAPHFTGTKDKDGSLFTGEYSSIKILRTFDVKINI